MKDLRARVQEVASQYNLAIAQIDSEEAALAEAELQYLAAAKAQDIAQKLAQGIQQRAHNRIASIVSKCLQSIFEEDAYEFQIIFDRKRGKTEARLVFVREGHEVDPTDAAGGGPRDIAALALRLASIALSQPRGRQLLVLDEPFRCIWAEYRPRVRALLETLATELEVQIIMVTHDSELQTGTVLELE